MRVVSCALSLVFVLVGQACAGDAKLDQLAHALKAIRGTHDAKSQYDAGPEFTPIKHLLRQWVETRLVPFAKEGDEAVLAKKLSAELTAAGLTCDGGAPREKRCGEPTGDTTEFNARGYLGDLDLSYLEYDHYLALKTRVGIRCGYDESLYVYERHGKAWQLLLESEQDRYSNTLYFPQRIQVIKSSFSGVGWNDSPVRPPLILTLGISPWCSSNWQMLYTRLWRASKTDASSKPLVDRRDSYFLGDENPGAAVSADGMLVEFDGNSVDGGVLIRPHIVHYALRDDEEVTRIAPVALSPRDFVDEWLTRPWIESSKWIDASTELVNLRTWYARYHRGVEIIFGEFGDGPYRCRSDQTLWQVEFTQQAGPKNQELPGYFLVRWMAPYRFTLVKIDNRRFPGCDIKDKMPDNLGTLFPF